MVSTDDAAILRGGYVSIGKVFLHIAKLETYATAKINGTPTMPTNEFTVDNTSADWEDADRVQLCKIYSGSSLKYFGGMSASPSATKLFLKQTSDGDSGISQEIYQSIADNDDITIYKCPYPDAVRSRIDPVTERTLKYRSLDFEDSFTVPPTEFPPAVNRVGRNQHAEVSPGGTAPFTLPHNGADGGESWNSGSLTYLWEVPTGVTIDGGFSDTDAVIEVTAEPGNYIVTRVISDDTAAADSGGRRWLFVTDGVDGDNPAFSDIYPPMALKIDDVGVEGKFAGFIGTFTIAVTRGQHSDLMEYLYPGAPVLVQENPRYSDDGWTTVETTTAYAVPDQWFGYLRQYANVGTDAQGRDVIEVEFVSPLIYYQKLPIAVQVLREVEPPENWQQAHPDMMHVAHWTFYLSYWHARQLFTSHDFYFDAEFASRFRAAFYNNEESVGTALQKAAEYVPGGFFTCGYDGSMYMKRLLNMVASGDRGGITTQWTFTAVDFKGQLTDQLLKFSRDPLMKVGETDGAAFIYGASGTTTTTRARMGLNAPFNGLGKTSFPDVIVDDAAELEQFTGDYHAYINRPTQNMPIRMAHEYLDPALLQPIAFSGLTSYDPITSGAFSNRGVVSKNTRSYRFTRQGILKGLFTELIPETRGKDAQTFAVDAIGAVASSCETLTLEGTRDTPLYSGIVTEIGATYQITVSGIVDFANDAANVEYDASYWNGVDGVWTDVVALSNPPYGDYAGLNINGARPTPVPAYNASHVYSFDYAGTGSAFMFFCNDEPGGYTNNSGSWTIEICRIS